MTMSIQSGFPRFCAGLLVSLCMIGISSAQNDAGNGFRVQERPGLALVKPQAWSKESESTVIEFLAFTDRTVKTSPGVGYFEFRTKHSDKYQVPASKVIRLYVYPDMGKVDLVTAEERQNIQTQIDDMDSMISRFPSTQTFFKKYIDQLKADGTEFDAGKVKVDGQWVAKGDFVKAKSANLAKLINSDLSRPEPVANLDLENDPRYLALLNLADSNPEAKVVANEISQRYQTLRRQEQRKEFLDVLSKSDTTSETAETAVKQLKELKPEEDEKSAAFVKLWDASVIQSKALGAETNRLKESLDGVLAENKDAEAAPEIPQEIIDQGQALTKSLLSYQATTPPKQLPVPAELAAALGKCIEGFVTLQGQYSEKKYFDAKITLEVLQPSSDIVGGNTKAVVSALNKFTQRETERFSALKDEAALLASSGRKSDAVGKYEEAYDIMPDPVIAQAIEDLKH